jgi:cell division protein ZapA (FtsZ GTPase activity inhibitor)
VSEEKTRVTVDIYGTQYKLLGNASPAYTRRVAAEVHEQMMQISQGNSRLDVHRIAVLAAVQAVDQHFRSQQEMEQLVQIARNYEKLQERESALLSQLEQSQATAAAAIEEKRRCRLSC